jgi:hypothetical protein
MITHATGRDPTSARGRMPRRHGSRPQVQVDEVGDVKVVLDDDHHPLRGCHRA